MESSCASRFAEGTACAGVIDDRFQSPDLAAEHARTKRRQCKISSPLIVITGSFV
jgi:hypothetical protein